MRWRTVLPEEAGIGFTPARLANAASERTRPGCDHAARATAAVTGPADVIPRGDQYPDGGADTVVGAGSTQHRHVNGQHGLGDAAGVQRVGLANSAVGAGVHPARLGDRVPGVVGDAGQAGAVGSHSLDHPQHIEITTGAAGDPRDGSLEACHGGRKLRFVDDLAGRAGHDSDGVVAGVRIDADDEWVSMRDDCHSDRRSSLQ